MKFYNIDAPEQTGTTTATIAPYQSGFVPNVNPIAEAMAKAGQRTEEGFTAQTPQVNTEVKPEEVTQTAAQGSAEPATQATPESVTEPVETSTATAEPPQAITPPVETPPTVVPSWQAVLKQQPNDAILKELGFDDATIGFVKELKGIDPKMVAFLQHWQTNGDVNEYLRALSTNYREMPAEDVMRHQLRKDYPKASDRQIELLYEEEVVRKYNLDSEEPEDVERGKLLLEAKSDRYRDSLVADQEKYFVPKPPEKPADDTASKEAQVLQQAEQTFSAAKQRVESNPAYKSLFQKGEFVIGEGEDAFTLKGVSPQEVADNLFDTINNYIAIGVLKPENINGLTDGFIEDNLLLRAISKDVRGFLKNYGQHIKSLGGKSVIDTIENVKQPGSDTPTQSDATPANAAAAMAKGGRITL